MLLDIILRYSYSFDYIKMQKYFPNTSNSYTLPSIISVNARLFESNISYMWDNRDFVTFPMIITSLKDETLHIFGISNQNLYPFIDHPQKHLTT